MLSNRRSARERGVATLLVALVLMMSVTIITLSVARSQLLEQIMASDDLWYNRLSLQAEAGLTQAQLLLAEDLDSLPWVAAPNSTLEFVRITQPASDPQIENAIALWRTPGRQDFIRSESSARRVDASSPEVTLSEWTRRLTVLTPLAEQAPPLVLNGCSDGTPADFNIRPLHADSDQAATAAWLGGACLPITAVDTHNGNVLTQPLAADLWTRLFTLDRESFRQLAADDAGLPDPQRRYYEVHDTDLHAGRWIRSVGDAFRPVILYIPAAIGCPGFSPGVQIFGLVFIDGNCGATSALRQLELYGTLAINGAFDISASTLQLNHIQVADSRLSQLRFPVLRSVALPGSWRDF